MQLIKQPETLQAMVDALELTYTAQFVPFSQSRNAKKATKPSDYSLNWKVTISKGSRRISTDYSAGIAHIPGYKQNWSGRMSVNEFEAIKYACENGKVGFDNSALMPALRVKTIPAPDLRDVVYSLMQDASVLDAASFEGWASDYGYSTDSREAERIYRECLKIALELRAMIGDTVLNDLRNAIQDY